MGTSSFNRAIILNLVIADSGAASIVDVYLCGLTSVAMSASLLIKWAKCLINLWMMKRKGRTVVVRKEGKAFRWDRWI